ncbi:hypothetical protein ANN_18163 [Periplaneta americana]|uniref:60S ribosomal protein L29 n=1 Tax=Periplaneta americana TaxID=6978 RepID=A0ABQ8SPF8_PERAM|nr:hypothetical protein ANN_18163 [Periplaneta americana]
MAGLWEGGNEPPGSLKASKKSPHNEVEAGWSCSKAATRQMGVRNHHVGPVHGKKNTRQAKKKMGRYIQAAAGKELVNHRPQQERVETDSEKTHIELKFDKL